MNVWSAYRVGMKTKTGGDGSLSAVIGQLARNIHRPERFSWTLRPIDFLRYREFDFALRAIGKLPKPRRVLGLSSPKLLPLTLASNLPDSEIVSTDILEREVDWTRNKADELKLSNVTTERADARCLLYPGESFDLVTSISVFEHIAPARDGDLPAIAEVFRVLKPGGTAIITVPFSREAFDEYQSGGVYERSAGSEKQFFQRFYDEPMLKSHFVERPAAEVSDLRFIDERYYFKSPHRRVAHVVNCSPIQNRVFGPLFPLLSHVFLSAPKSLDKCGKPYIACLCLRKPDVPSSLSEPMCCDRS